LQYLCQLGDQELRQQTTRAMADFLWNSIKVLSPFYSVGMRIRIRILASKYGYRVKAQNLEKVLK
jgi:hypothetical protein